MPCYSTIETKLLDLVMIQKAIKEIGARILAQSPNNIVIEKDGEHISLMRSREGENFILMTNRSSDDYEKLLDSLTVSYAKNTLKAWATKSGYSFSAGSKPGEYVMNKYNGG